MNQHRKSLVFNKFYWAMAVLLSCLPAPSQQVNDRDDSQNQRPDLKVILDSNPDPAKALALYIRWLQEPNSQNLDTLKKNDLVRARAALNGYHTFGLPDGLERFLPAYDFGDKYEKIAKALRDSNTAMTLEDAAEIWTKGYDAPGNSGFAKSLRKLNVEYRNALKTRLGLPPETLLSSTQLSQLSPPLVESMMDVGREYSLNVEKALSTRSDQIKKGKHQA